ncbi:hypothetical protein MKY96_10580 [Paenibacillus sp. FSL R7-0302]|uniref:hypothetical protein n=1 Tax=Paenibacillus sp. FSL R7-0302 TaxID=2921681 RepID=UPI0030F7A497
MDKTPKATDSTTVCSSSIWPCWTASPLERGRLWAGGLGLDGWVGMGVVEQELGGRVIMGVVE